MHGKNYNSCWKHLVWRHQNNISINSCRTNLYQSWIIFQLSFSKPPFQLSPQKTPLFEYSLKKTLVFHGSSGEVWQYIIYWSKWNILVHGISLITCKLCTCNQNIFIMTNYLVTILTLVCLEGEGGGVYWYMYWWILGQGQVRGANFKMWWPLSLSFFYFLNHTYIYCAMKYNYNFFSNSDTLESNLPALVLPLANNPP